MTLLWRVWSAIMLINLIVLSVFIGLATLRYASINADLVGERLSVFTRRTAVPFTTALALGLSLEEVRNAPVMLERARQTDGRIKALHVFDEQGRIVHSTSIDPPESLPAQAIAAHRSADDRSWHRETDQGFLSGVAIRSGSNASAGGLLVVYPRQASIARVWAMAAELAAAGMAVLLLAGGFGIVLLRFGLRQMIADYRRVQHGVEAFEKRAWRLSFGPSPLAAPGLDVDEEDDLGSLISRAEHRYWSTRRRLDDIGSGEPPHEG